MARHIAYDIGARGVTLELARLHARRRRCSTRFSRLVIDPNRGEDDPTLVMRLYDGTIIPANRHVTPEEVERRLDAWHRPYHRAIDAAIERMGRGRRWCRSIPTRRSSGAGRRGRGRWGSCGTTTGGWRGRCSRGCGPRGICVGDNEPYSGELEGDTMSRHGTGRGLAHVLIELRQDLIATPEDQAAWAARLAPILARAIEEIADG